MEKSRLELIFGTPVTFQGAPLGRLAGLGLEVASGRLAYLAVALGPLGRDLRRLSPEAVAHAAPEGIATNLSSEEAHSLERLGSGRRRRPQTADAVYLHKSTRVHPYQSGRLVGALVARADLLLSHLVVAEGATLRRRSYLVPGDAVADFAADSLTLKATGEGTDWPLYRSDQELRAEVLRRLPRLPALGEFDRRSLSLQVVDGIAHLAGNVRSPLAKRQAAQAARTVAGVQGVRDEIIDDISLETTVAQALAADPRMRDARIAIAAHNGHLTLRGAVTSRGQELAAVAVAQAVPGVRQAISELKIAPREGGERRL